MKNIYIEKKNWFMNAMWRILYSVFPFKAITDKFDWFDRIDGLMGATGKGWWYYRFIGYPSAKTISFIVHSSRRWTIYLRFAWNLDRILLLSPLYAWWNLNSGKCMVKLELRKYSVAEMQISLVALVALVAWCALFHSYPHTLAIDHCKYGRNTSYLKHADMKMMN